MQQRGGGSMDAAPPGTGGGGSMQQVSGGGTPAPVPMHSALHSLQPGPQQLQHPLAGRAQAQAQAQQVLLQGGYAVEQHTLQQLLAMQQRQVQALSQSQQQQQQHQFPQWGSTSGTMQQLPPQQPMAGLMQGGGMLQQQPAVMGGGTVPMRPQQVQQMQHAGGMAQFSGQQPAYGTY